MANTVGIIGFGTMGRPMGAHLHAKGYEVSVFDITGDAVAEAQRSGFQTVGSPRELAEVADVIFIVVGFDNEVREVVYGPDGLIEGCRSGTVVIVSSTVVPTLMVELADSFKEQGVNVADAPLIRGVPAALAGELLATVGADDVVYEQLQPYLHSFATDIVHMGGVGCGQVAKALNNYLLWACHCANYEMFKVSDVFGIDRSVMKDALLLGSGANTPLTSWLTPTFGPFPWAEKDMSILLSVSDDLCSSLPVAGVVREAIKAVKSEFGFATPKSTLH